MLLLHKKKYKLLNKLSNNFQKQIYKNKIFRKFSNIMGNELYINSNYDEETIRYKIKNIILQSILINIVSLLACLILYGFNYYMIIIYAFLTILGIRVNIKRILNQDNKKVLEQIPELIIEIKSSYYENKMILESLSDSIKNVPYEVSLKAIEIYGILSSPNSKVEVEKYNREGRNTYLKMLLNILYITKEFGDSKKNGQSIFARNLNYLLEEVNIEIQKQKMIKSKLKGLIFSALFPIAFINFIEKWSITNFEVLNEFYQSSTGFLIKNLVVFITIIVVILIINIQSFDEKVRRKNLEEDIINGIYNNKNFKKLLGIIKPKENTKTYNAMLRLMNNSREESSINNIYCRKICYAAIGLILSLAMVVRANFYVSYGKETLYIIEGILIILITFIGYMFPNMLMNNRKKFIEAEMKTEVNKFNTLILLLMNYERVSVELLLEYMEKFSENYRNSIKRCMLDFEKSKETALENFKNEVNDKSFKRLIRNLVLCVRNIKISEAFEFLETERKFYKDDLKQVNELAVNEKYNLARLLGYIPYYTLVILYFVLPIIYTSVVELMSMIEQIKNI